MRPTMFVCLGFCTLIMDLIHLPLSSSLSVKMNFVHRLGMCFERHKNKTLQVDVRRIISVPSQLIE